MKRSPLRRKSPLRSKPRKRSDAEKEARENFRRAVIASAYPLLADEDRADLARFQRAGRSAWIGTDAHHVLTEQFLRRWASDHGLDPLAVAYDPRIGMHVSRRRHEQHHATKPISRAELPASVFDFCEEHGLEWKLDEIYGEDG